MAERFREQVNYRPISAETGAASSMLSLAQKLEGFKNFAYQKASQIGQERAIERGVTRAGQVKLGKDESGITKAPKFEDKRFIGGVEINAYNKALRSSYLSSLNADIRIGVNEIRENNFDDLAGFNDKIESYKNAMLKTVDPSSRSQVEGLFNDIETTARLNVQSATIKKNYEAAKFETENSGNLILEDALTYANNGDFLSASQGLLDYNQNLMDRIESGYLSEGEAKELSRKATVLLTQENLTGDIRRKTQDGDYDKAIKQIVGARQNIPKGMSPREHGELLTSMISELNQSLNLQNKLEKDEDDARKERQRTNYSDLIIGVSEGTKSKDDAVKLLRASAINDTQFEKVMSVLNSRGQGTNDYTLVNQIKDAISDFGAGGQVMTADMIQGAIISNMGTSLTENQATALLSDLRMYQQPDFILNSKTVKRAKSFITPSMRVVGIAGSFDTEAERRLANALREFDNRVIDGEDPWAVADELIGKDAVDRLSDPMFGSKDDLKTAKEKLDEAAKNGEIDRPTFNYQNNLITELRQLIENNKRFEEAKKNANR